MRASSFSICLLFVFFCFVSVCQAQIQGTPIGTWKSHVSYYNQTKIITTPSAVFAASEASLIRIDKATLSVEAITKIDGLSEVNISAMAYHPKTKTVVIGYNSGNIDLLKADGSIVNISGIKRFNFFGSKVINHIAAYKSDAYLSCDFGLVIINVEKEEIKNSNISLSSTSSTLTVNCSAVNNDSLYLATTEGLKVAPLSANLTDGLSFKSLTYNYGLPQTTVGNPVIPYQLISFKDYLLVHLRSNSNSYCYIKDGANFRNTNLGELSGTINRFSTNGDTLLALTNNRLVKLGSDFKPRTLLDTSFFILLDAEQDAEGKLWISDFTKTPGYWENGKLNPISSDSPIMQTAIRMTAFADKVAFASGGYNASFYSKNGNAAGFSVLGKKGWKNYSFYKLPRPYYEDCSHLSYDAVNKKLFASLWGGGLMLVDIDEDGSYKSHELWNESFPANTSLNTIDNSKAQCRVSATAIDKKHQLFISTFVYQTGKTSLSKYSFTDKSFTPIISPDVSAPSYECPMDILVADNNDKWVRVAQNRTSPASLWVFNDLGQQRGLSTSPNSGNLPDATVNDIAKDIDGSIWVGTNIGAAVFYNPTAATRVTTSINAVTPIFEGRPILESEQVTAIAIDGGGRKWFGTRRSGIYLYDKEISRSLQYFNTENSPLPSNNILDICINKVSGEVFIATDLGIVSYRSDATDPDVDGNKIVVFPNPVTPNYQGILGIRGLPENSEVKITDAAGRKVFEGKSNGGGLSWNLQDYNNRKAKTGIYFVYASNEDGTDTLVGKFAVVE